MYYIYISQCICHILGSFVFFARPRCAFWDVAADRWSTEGVQTLALPNASGGVAKCATTHLSMFGFLVRTVTMVFVSWTKLNLFLFGCLSKKIEEAAAPVKLALQLLIGK